MEEHLCEFYNVLPSLANCSFYIPGYTETLSHVDGVRVVPSYDFLEAVPIQFRNLFEVAGFPCYYVPIKLGKKHFGFILKGLSKTNSRFSTYYPFFNLESLISPKSYVFVAEGIKDTGIFLLRKEPALGMLTSGMSEEMTKVFTEFGKTPIFVQDNDLAGNNGMAKMFRNLKKRDVPFFRVRPEGHKDMGDFFDHPEQRVYVEATYSRAYAIAQSLQGSGSFLKRAVFDGLTTGR